MKQIFFNTVIAFLISTIFLASSCQKEGPVGPAGPAGAVGPTGATGAAGQNGAKGDEGDKGDKGDKGPAGQNGAKGDKGDKGADGNMKIIAKNITISSSQWIPITYFSFHDASENVSEITQGILSGGAVIAYEIESSMYYSLPYTENGVSVSIRLMVGKFNVHKSYDRVKAPPGTCNFRLIIIPGATSGRVQSSNRVSYSIDQLRKLSYEEVCKILNIQQ